MRCGAKVDVDVRIAPGQPLAGADIKRHTGPAPVFNFAAQRHKGFASAVGLHTGFAAVAGHFPAIDAASGVLAANCMLAQGLRCPGFERAQHLAFFIANRVCCGIDRRLHANGAQQLQGMVLHHVAQSAGGVIKRAALFYAKLFGNRDLDIGNMFAPPERLEQCVAKAQRKQVLHRRFAQVMVNAKHLLFVKNAAYRVVDRPVGSQVVAQRLFQHDAGLGRVQSRRSNLLAHDGEQGRRSRQVHHHGVGLAFSQPICQPRIVPRMGQVHLHKVQQLGKCVELFRHGLLGQLNLVKTRLNLRPVVRCTQVVPAYANDAPTGWQRAMAKSLKQRRHQFAPHQVASAAKQNQVKSHENFLRGV